MTVAYVKYEEKYNKPKLWGSFVGFGWGKGANSKLFDLPNIRLELVSK